MKLGYFLNKLFGPAYVKNLKASTDRFERITKECESIDLQYEIIEAVDGTKHCDSNYTIHHGHHKIAHPASAGFLGVHLTTEKIILDAINKKNDCVMVFDDDCVFSHTNKIDSNKFNDLEKKLPTEWDIIILGNIQVCEDYINTPITFKKCRLNGEAAGSHGVVINKNIYELYYSFIKEKKLWGDAIIGHFIDIGKNIYIIHPSLCQQNRTIYSDINKCFLNDCNGTAIIPA